MSSSLLGRKLERFEKENKALRARLSELQEFVEWVATWGNGCPANSEYDKGLKAAHDAFSSQARKLLASREKKG